MPCGHIIQGMYKGAMMSVRTPTKVMILNHPHGFYANPLSHYVLSNCEQYLSGLALWLMHNLQSPFIRWDPLISPNATPLTQVFC